MIKGKSSSFHLQWQWKHISIVFFQDNTTIPTCGQCRFANVAVVHVNGAKSVGTRVQIGIENWNRKPTSHIVPIRVVKTNGLLYSSDRFVAFACIGRICSTTATIQRLRSDCRQLTFKSDSFSNLCSDCATISTQRKQPPKVCFKLFCIYGIYCDLWLSDYKSRFSLDSVWAKVAPVC